MNISPFLSVNHSCDEALQWTKKLLLQARLRPMQTFDLHTARVGLQDCPCPNHGTNECDCQIGGRAGLRESRRTCNLDPAWQ